jgi:hypothetical protein
VYEAKVEWELSGKLDGAGFLIVSSDGASLKLFSAADKRGNPFHRKGPARLEGVLILANAGVPPASFCHGSIIRPL